MTFGHPPPPTTSSTSTSASTAPNNNPSPSVLPAISASGSSPPNQLHLNFNHHPNLNLSNPSHQAINSIQPKAPQQPPPQLMHHHHPPLNHQIPFQHLPPPPGFPHLHPPHHLQPPLLSQPHPHPHPHPHQFQIHHPTNNYLAQNNRHPGLGSHPQPNIPLNPSINHPHPHPHPQPQSQPTNPQPPPNSVTLPTRPAPTEIYSLFVGSIAEGVDDAWLERLLGCAGHLVSLRRIRDPNGKPKPFGFAEYGDPESVLRCLKVIHGAQLPINGGKGGEKSIMVKPDDKTKARLDTYESTRIKTDQDAELDAQAIERLEGLISQMKDPDILAATASDPNSTNNLNNGNGTPSSKKNSAAHLQDLAPEDLPEESRGTITREIQFFRERAISKRGDAEKAAKEREKSNREAGSGSPIGPRGYGSSNTKTAYGSSNNTPMGPRANTNPTSTTSSSNSNDPQSFNRPMGFVRAGQIAAAQQHLNNPSIGSISNNDPSIPLTDEEEEKLRQERRKRMDHMEFKERERRWETRERNRAQTYQRDQQREKAIKEEEIRLRNLMKNRLANWDDEIEMERGKELFYSNRLKWRLTRRPFRQREEKSDRIDQELETEQLEAIRKESEEFLNKQAEMIAKMHDENRKAGLLQIDEGGKPIQLSFGGLTNNQNGSLKPINVIGGTSGIQPISFKKDGKLPGGLLGNGDDDDDGFRKKRALIPLTYDDDDDDEVNEANQSQEHLSATKINIKFGKSNTPSKDSGISEDKKKIKMKDIVASVPIDKEQLWEVKINWDWLSESVIEDKLKPFANKKIMEYLGLQEDELVTAIIDHIRARKDAPGLVEELEPVLAEEAEEFTLKFWRMLVFEVRAAEAGITSTPST
ncbi:hypothetical protein O181_012588 [Austropuccinia psidii MF-1]|uniref:PWI domain-containing protein n=1 Tax=Austropuccinia psidii MF-1 TaxID=1389203 RepID=A0A9Q3BXK8_9BASI|nr:hypothetical protein [Austropuccinia psidii MF-1]